MSTNDKNPNLDKKSKDFSLLYIVVRSITVGFLIAFLITRIILPTKIMGSSMYPTLIDGDYVLVNRLDKKPDREDIIVFYYGILDQEYLVKRVIAISGDRYEINHGEVFINGSRIEESYVKEEWVEKNFSGLVPEGYIFVMGDNRNSSVDSRSFGLVEVSEVIGKVLLK